MESVIAARTGWDYYQIKRQPSSWLRRILICWSVEAEALNALAEADRPDTSGGGRSYSAAELAAMGIVKVE